MGDANNDDLRVSFDSRLKLKLLGSQITTDAGLLAYRELDEAIRLTEMADDLFRDSRLGSNKQHRLLPLLRQSIYSRLAGYEDVNDAERLSVDPGMRHVVGGRAALADKRAASTSEVGRFETEIINTSSNLKKLMDLSGEWIDKVHRCEPLKQLILDLDSSVSETYGKQEGTAYNGHFECNCYHPLFLFDQFGDLERTMLRRGNNASAKFWRRVLLPVIERYRHLDIPKFFRGDAAFANPALYRRTGERRISLRHSPQGQRGLGAGNRASSDASCGSPITQTQGVLSQLPIPGEILAAAAPCSRQGRVARRGTVPASRLHCDQLEQALEECDQVLQRSWHGGAVDQRRQERRQMDEALLPHVQGQPDTVAVVRLGLQAGQLLAATGFAP